MKTCPKCRKISVDNALCCDCGYKWPKAKKEQQSSDMDHATNPLLISCKSCSHQFSKRANECPKCGWKLLVTCQVCNKNIPFGSKSCPECGDPNPFEKGMSFFNHNNDQAEKIKTNKDNLNKSSNPINSSPEKRRHKLLATIVCILIYFLFYILIAGPLGWKHGGGFIPQTALFLIIFSTWFAIARKG